MSEIIAEYYLRGHPAVLKNSKKIVMIPVRKGSKQKRPIIIESSLAKKYRDRIMAQLYIDRGPAPTITGPISAEMIFYGAWKGDGKSIPDISNLYQMPEDLMQAAGIIDDDRLIQNHDGSARVCLCDYACPKKRLITQGPNKGKYKPDCGAVKKCTYECVRIRLRHAEPMRPDLVDWGGGW